MEEKPFDKYEKRGAYHWSWYENNTYGYADSANLVLSLLPSSGTAIDVGGGDGLISYKMFRRGLSVTCLDTNPRAIDLARRWSENNIYGKFRNFTGVRNALFAMNVRRNSVLERYLNGNLRFICGTLDVLPADWHFDYAVCHEVIEHIPEPAAFVEQLLSRVRRFAIISTPDAALMPPHPLDYQNWTRDSFGDLLRAYECRWITPYHDSQKLYVVVSNKKPAS